MKKIVLVTGLCLIVLTAAWFEFRATAKADPRGSLYAGPGKCAKCHSDIYNSFLHTAHYVASLPATDATVHGKFAKGANVFAVNDAQKVVMEKLDSGMFQTYYLNGKVKKRYRFDIVFGGVKGETYLFWRGNQLFQLPLSYFKQHHQWSTSPGYQYNFLDYPMSRSISKRCLECHASYISDMEGQSQKLDKSETFDKSSVVFSIDCERCHGPAAQHVAFQTENPGVKTARYITTYSSLTRPQKIDMCAQCHSGKPGVMLRSSFEFVPGDTLSKFRMAELFQKVDTAHLDVHGNQVQLLESSKCFIHSKMDCASCHDTHINSRGNDALFTQKCFACHNTPNHVYCKMTDKLNAGVLKANCINCHMPALPTKVISVQVSDKLPSIQFFVHTHHITIYPQETKKVLAFINKQL